MAVIRITPGIALDEAELEERFVLASGPGGQNVNKVSTAVELRFDVARSPSLPSDVRVRLMALAGRRLTKEGVLVIDARQLRTQERNRADARERLFSLIRAASVVPRKRYKTRTPTSAKRKRVDKKTARGALKRLRSKPGME